MICPLCPHHCDLAGGKTGLCKVRRGGSRTGSRDGGNGIETPYYGRLSALSLDPIEKKPLYHFRPGSDILSAGFVGCNLRCPFCQNWHISQELSARTVYLSPGELIGKALENPGGAAVAYTYSEPLVHYEYLLDAMGEGRRRRAANVLVTNGCAAEAAADRVLSLTDAVNVDLKSFSAETYRNVLGGSLDEVKAFIGIAAEKGVHLEVTTLVVPGLNDSEGELTAAAEFIAGFKDGGVPWHLSAYHPDWKWDAPPTKSEALFRAANRARMTLRYVYAGNTPGEENSTFCPSCGAPLVSRRGYRVRLENLVFRGEAEKPAYVCKVCGKPAPFTW